MSAPAVTQRRDAELDRLREVLVMALVATIPLAVGRVIWWSTGGEGDFNRRVSVSPFDVPLLMILVLAIVDRRRDGGAPFGGWTRRLAIALAVVLAVAFVAHPSPRGVDLAVRVAAALAVADAFRRFGAASRQRVLATIVVVGSIEATIAMLEAARKATVGLGPLEFSGSFVPFGTSAPGRAGFDHPYHLACFLLVALGAAVVGFEQSRRKPPWVAAAALIGAGLATTYSRAALITLVVVLGLLVIARRGDTTGVSRRTLAVALAVAFAIGAVGFGNGWRARSEQTLTGTNVASDRTELARGGLRLIEDHPLLGIGPGRLTIALGDIAPEFRLPPHNVVIHEGAEGGVLAAALTAALLVALGLRAVRGGWLPMLVVSTLVFFYLLDAYPYTFPAGIAMSGLWLGILNVASHPPTSDD